MTEKEKPGAALLSGHRADDLPRQSGDEFEDRVKDAVRKQDQILLEATIGELLSDLGPPELDTEQKRGGRDFLCRLLVEALDAVGVIEPMTGSDELKIVVAFRGEQFARHFIGSDLVPASLLVARLRRLRGCELRYFPRVEGGAQ